MEITTIEMAGLVSAMRALRLPYNKGVRSETDTDCTVENAFWEWETPDVLWCEPTKRVDTGSGVLFSPEDVKLAKKLILRGDSHAKPMRGVIVYADITAPIDFWCELETYRAGHERLFSASTMNTEGSKLRGRELREALDGISFGRPIRKIDLFSYQCLRNIVRWRHNHRKLEWHQFIEWVGGLPMAEEFILVGLESEIAVHDKMLMEMEADYER